MKYEYFKLPIPFSEILSRKEIEKTNIRFSINQKIQLILLTYFGECRYNPKFGCVVWEYDFTNVSNENAWRDLVVGSLTETLVSNEPRLQNISIKVNIKEEEFDDPDGEEEFDLSDYLDDDSADYKTQVNNHSKDDEERVIPLSGEQSFQEKLTEQLHLLYLEDSQFVIADVVVLFGIKP